MNKCRHDFYEWPRTAIGIDRTRQCVKCGDKEKMKMEWGVRTGTDVLKWNERCVGDWTADGNSDPKWVRSIHGLKTLA